MNWGEYCRCEAGDEHPRYHGYECPVYGAWIQTPQGKSWLRDPRGNWREESDVRDGPEFHKPAGQTKAREVMRLTTDEIIRIEAVQTVAILNQKYSTSVSQLISEAERVEKYIKGGRDNGGPTEQTRGV